MKILHVYKTYYPDTFGGIEQVIAQLARALASRGHENRIFTLSPNPTPPVLQRPEAEVYRSRTTIEVASNPVSIGALADFKAQLEWADVVHYQFPWPFGDLLHVCCGRRKPSIVSYQSDVVRQKWLRHVYSPLMNHFLRSVDMVVATSPEYRETSAVLAHLRTPLRVIPNGIDEASFPPLDPARLAHWRERLGGEFLLFVGVLRYYKGLHTLVEACDGFPGQVVIAGDGPQAGVLRVEVAARKLSNLQLIGKVSDPDKVCLLRLCRGFVLPSHLRSEAFGMSLVEAAMFGKPMVSCEIGSGMSYINRDGVTGWTVPPESPAALRERMLRLLRDPDEAARMGAAARQRFETLFTAEAMASAYEAAYRELLASAVR
jgi:O-antigen biosynthesis rhamnosyltransferase